MLKQMRIHDADINPELAKNVKSFPPKRKRPQQWEKEADQILSKILQKYRNMDKASDHNNQQTVE